MVNKYTLVGSTMFGTAVTGLGLVHFFYPGFRPVFLPVQPTADFTILPIALGLSLVLAGLGIILSKRKNVIAVFLAAELALFFLFGHLPNRLKYHPDILGVWTDAIKLIALIGGALLIADQASDRKIGGRIKIIGKITPAGRYLFSLMLVLFGLDHFVYNDLVSSLIPKWIPLKSFWTYFTGAALLGAGIFIGLNILKRQASLWLAFMLFLWLILLHLPAFLSGPDKDAVNIVSSLECLAFCGTALLCAQQKENSNGVEERLG